VRASMAHISCFISVLAYRRSLAGCAVCSFQSESASFVLGLCVVTETSVYGRIVLVFFSLCYSSVCEVAHENPKTYHFLVDLYTEPG
jgi:hypothetical protein